MSAAAFWSGLAGVVVGSLTQVGIVWFRHHLESNKQNELDEARKKILKKMLENPKHEFRKIQTLSSVIGANEDVTRRLLIEIDARGSETGNDGWALLSRKPLPVDKP